MERVVPRRLPGWVSTAIIITSVTAVVVMGFCLGFDAGADFTENFYQANYECVAK